MSSRRGYSGWHVTRTFLSAGDGRKRTQKAQNRNANIPVRAFLLEHLEPIPPPIESLDTRLNGLSGWLILVAIGLIAAPIKIVVDMAQALHAYGADTWHALTIPGSESFHPLWAPVLIFDLLGSITFLILFALALVLFFQKRRLFPKVFITILIAGLIYSMVLYGAQEAIPLLAEEFGQQAAGDVSRSLLAAIIWTSYMTYSKRVKATFIR